MSRRWIALIVAASLLAGCRGPSAGSGWEQFEKDRQRDTEKAKKHYVKAMRYLEEDDLDAAESELRAAIEADLFYGMAHNNLGVICYRRKEYYKAAWEFQYAAKLMPTQAEPKYNMGMVFEAVGKLDEAAQWYEQALSVEPDAVPVIANLARVYVREDRKDEKTRNLLEQVVLKDSRPQWVDWARRRLALMGPETPKERTLFKPDPQDEE